MSYDKLVTPTQTEQAPGTVINSAGGYAFPVDKWMRYQRFLILGSDSGSYYATPRDLTQQNHACITMCAAEDGIRAVDMAVHVSSKGLAHKNEPAILALAVLSCAESLETRKYALKNTHNICRIPTHYFTFCKYRECFGGWGRGMREAIARYYNDTPIDKLVYQTLKYKQRGGWSHCDLLRLCHAKPANEDRDRVFGYLTGKTESFGLYKDVAEIADLECDDYLKLIEREGITHEMLPTELSSQPHVQKVLLKNMPIMATVRNLGRFTASGAITPLSDEVQMICDRLTNVEIIRNARMHPMHFLMALRTYQSGGGQRSSLTWNPVSMIISALEEAFYLSIETVKPSNKRIMLALDVSGSMSWSMNTSYLSCAEGAAAMAMITNRVEKNVQTMAFTSTFRPLPFSKETDLNSAINMTASLNFGGTDCAIPMLYAMHNKIECDAFIVYTDNETWAGAVHPYKALKDYRRKMGIDAKLVVVGMESNGFSIADPNDAGMLDVVGFDASAPQVISQFVAGGLE